MYLLKELNMTNFKCYRGTHHLDFEGKNVVGVVARYVSSSDRSNWAGKSSIGDAIRYLLYGKVAASLSEKIVSYDEQSSTVEGVLVDHCGREVRIIRSITSNGNSSLSVDGEEGVERSETIIGELLGLSYNDWLLSAYFQQNDVQRFTELGPADKRNEVQRWIERDCWASLYRLAKDRLREVSNDIDHNRIIGNQTYDDVKDLQYQLRKLQEELSVAKNTANGYFEKMSSYSAASSQLAIMRNRLHSYMKEWMKFIYSNNNIIYDYECVIKSDEIVPVETRLSEINSLYDDAKEKLSSARRRYKELESNATGYFSGKCPVDGKPCPRSEELREGSSCRELLPSAKKDMNDAEETYNKLSRLKQGLEQQLSLLRREYDFLCSKQTSIVNCPEIDYDSLYNEYLEAKKVVDEQIDYTSDYKAVEARISSIGREIGILEQKIIVASRIIEEIRVAKEKIRELEIKGAALTFLVYSFSKDGIAASQVEDSLNMIVEVADGLLNNLGTGLGMKFSYEKELKKKSDMCYDCGTVFPQRARNCPNCNKPRPYKRSSALGIDVCVDGQWGELDLQSGGCQALVAIMLRFALSKMLRNRGKLSLSLGWIDEILGSLDPVNRVALAREIVKGNDLGLTQRIIVTHNEEIQEMLPDNLLVERDGKWSTVSWM